MPRKSNVQPQAQLPQTPDNKRKGLRSSTSCLSTPNTPADKIFDTPGSVGTDITPPSSIRRSEVGGLLDGVRKLNLSGGAPGRRDAQEAHFSAVHEYHYSTPKTSIHSRFHEVHRVIRKDDDSACAAENSPTRNAPKNKSPGRDTDDFASPPRAVGEPGPFRLIGAYLPNYKAGESVEVLMHNQARQSLSPEDFKSGWLYILKDPYHPGHVKIGMTEEKNRVAKKDEIETRLQAHLCRCHRDYRLCFPQKGEHERERSPHIKRVEALVHAELHYFRRQVNCDCGTRHREWFEMELDIAVDIVEKWMSWMREKPYGEGTRAGLKPKLKDDDLEEVCQPHPDLPV
jgi:hypothetical protein